MSRQVMLRDIALRSGGSAVISMTAVTLPEYCSSVALLAESAHSVGGFPGLLAASSEDANCSAHPLVIRRVYSTRLPSSSGCAERAECRWPCGYRRLWPVKFRGVADVLHRSFDALVLDADWSFRASPRSLLGHRAEVVAVTEPPWMGTDVVVLNIGRMLIRSTPATIALAARVANRSTVAWDQIVFNEEISFSSVQCCHSRRLMDGLFAPNSTTHSGHGLIRKPGHISLWRLLASCIDPAEFQALPPPSRAVHEKRTSFRGVWAPGRLNAQRRMRSRCADFPC